MRSREGKSCSLGRRDPRCSSWSSIQTSGNSSAGRKRVRYSFSMTLEDPSSPDRAARHVFRVRPCRAGAVAWHGLHRQPETMSRLRVAIVADLLEEGWPSMDLMAEMLMAELGARRVRCRSAARAPGVPATAHASAAQEQRPPGADDRPHRASLLGLPAICSGATRADVYHIVDHSYAHLARELPAGRVVVTCHDIDAFRTLLAPGQRESSLPRGSSRACCAAFARRHSSRATARPRARSSSTTGSCRRPHLRRAQRRAPVVHRPTPSPRPTPRRQRSPGRPAGLELLHVGSTIPRKRIDVLLEVFARVVERRPDVRLLRVGGAVHRGAGGPRRRARVLAVTSSCCRSSSGRCWRRSIGAPRWCCCRRSVRDSACRSSKRWRAARPSSPAICRFSRGRRDGRSLLRRRRRRRVERHACCDARGARWPMPCDGPRGATPRSRGAAQFSWARCAEQMRAIYAGWQRAPESRRDTPPDASCTSASSIRPHRGHGEGRAAALRERARDAALDSRVLVANTSPRTVEDAVRGVAGDTRGRLRRPSARWGSVRRFPVAMAPAHRATSPCIHEPNPVALVSDWLARAAGPAGGVVPQRSAAPAVEVPADLSAVPATRPGACRARSSSRRRILPRTPRSLQPFRDKCVVIPFGIDRERLAVTPRSRAA